MAFEDIQNDPDLMQAIRRTGLPQYQAGPGPRPTTYDWLNQIAHAMSLGLMGRGGVGSPLGEEMTQFGKITRGMPNPMQIPPAGSAAIEQPSLSVIQRMKVPGAAKPPTGRVSGRPSPKLRPEAGPEFPSRDIGPENPLYGSDAPALEQPMETTLEAIRHRVAPYKEPTARPAKFTKEQLSETLGRVRSGVEGSMDELSEMLSGVIGKISRNFAPKLKSGAMDQADLFQEGQETLMRLATNPAYDPSKPFLPYLNRELVSRFQELITKSSPLQMGRDEGQLIQRLNRINTLSYKMTGRMRSADELSKMTGVPVEKIWSIYRGVEDMKRMNPPVRPSVPNVEAAGTKDLWQRIWEGP